MKKLVSLLFVICAVLCLSSCDVSGGNVDNVIIREWEKSDIYSDDDISSAIDTAIRYFDKEFDDCTLKEIYYPGDEKKDEFEDWARQYGVDEVIVLYSTFETGSGAGAGGFNENSEYTGWSWILVRNDGGQ